jgi:nucleoside phosphorylase
VIAVVCAVPAERRALADLAGPGVEVHVSGMGAAAARRAGDRIAAARPRALVAAGFCGALAPGLRTGDLVAGEEVAEEATGERFAADPELLAASPGRRGTLVSAIRLARTPEDRARLDGLAVDLESAALARAALAQSVPFLSLRAVTDEARHRMPDFDRLMDAAGRLNPLSGILYFVRYPREVPALLRLAPAARAASRALRGGVGELLERVA